MKLGVQIIVHMEYFGDRRKAAATEDASLPAVSALLL